MAGLLDRTPGYNPDASGFNANWLGGGAGTDVGDLLMALGSGIAKEGRFGPGIAAGIGNLNGMQERQIRKVLLGEQLRSGRAQTADLERKRLQAQQYRASLPPDSPLANLPDEQLLSAAQSLATKDQFEPYTAPGGAVGQRNKLTSEVKYDPEIAQPATLLANRAATIEGAKSGATLNDRMKVAEAGRSPTTVNVDTTNKPFYTTLGEGAAKDLLGGRDTAKAAARQIEAVRQARDLVDQGIISGPAAEARLGLARIGTFFGLGGDQVANTEAFTSSVGRQTLDLVKQLGAGSGISNADREFAEKVAGGSIKFTEEGLRRILDINERASAEIVAKHNKGIEPYLNDKFIPQSIRDSLKVDAPGPRPQRQGVPPNAKQVGTYQGKRVFEIGGQRFVED